jgi:hypothetical protein
MEVTQMVTQTVTQMVTLLLGIHLWTPSSAAAPMEQRQTLVAAARQLAQQLFMLV